MAEPKRGSKEAFLESEKRRKDRVKSKAKGFNIFKLSGVDKRKKENEAFNKKVKAKNLKARNENPSYKKFVESETRRLTRLTKANPNNKVVKKKLEKHLAKVQPKTEIKKDFVSKAFIAKGADLASKSGAPKKTETKNPLAPPKKVAADTTAKVKTDAKVNLSSFGEAFKKARAQGVGTKFAYNDKQYAAVTKDDIRRSGASSLTEFLNKTKRQETKIAKAPGQITEMKQQGGMAGGLTGSIDRLKERLKQYKEEEERSPGIKMRREEQGEANRKKFVDRLRERSKRRRAGPGAIGGRPSPKAKPRPQQPAPKTRRERSPFNPMPDSRPERVMTPAAASDQEMMSMKRAIMKDERMDRMKSGGSVMARGGRMGRSKPTKMY